MTPIRSVLLLLRFPPDFAGGALQASRLMQELSGTGMSMRVLTTLGKDGGGASREQAFGGEVRRFRVFGGVTAREIMLSLQAAWWLLTHSDWDILHCSGFSYFAILPRFVARLKRKPVLAKTTLLGSNGAFNPGGGPLAKKILASYGNLDAIVALSQALEDDLRSQEHVRARILQIPNGVDTELFRPASEAERAAARERLGLPADAFVITSVGMLYPRKNVVALVRALGRTKTRPVCVALAGPSGSDAGYLAEFERAVADLPEGASVVRLGSLPPDQLAALQQAADLFVLISRAEGMPNALLEAMSAGVACVASDIPGAADVLADGGGVLVPLDDDEALTAVVDRLASDPKERRRLGSLARQIVEDRYSLSRVAGRYRALYESLLEPGTAPMKILVNATSCRVAGGRSVALNFLRSYVEGDFPHELVVYAAPGIGYEELRCDKVRVEIAPPSVSRRFTRPWVDNVWFRRVLKRERPDVLFSMGSIAQPSKVPQLVLFHWPYAIYPEADVWQRMSATSRVTRGIRRFYFGRRARHASCFAAQTETARARLGRIWSLENTAVVPNAVSLPRETVGAFSRFLPAGTIPRGHRALLCLSRYYPHKNLEGLLAVAEEIQQRGLRWVILTTVARSDDPSAGAFLDQIAERGLERVIVNLGTVPMDEVPALYEASSALLLPTLLESFSGTYVESMFYGKPIFTSDRDFAHDVCGDVAWYFDPLDPHSILGCIEEAFRDPMEVARRVREGQKRCDGLPDWPEVTRRYIALLEQVAEGRRSDFA